MREMYEWNPMEMKLRFEEKAKQCGCSLTKYVEKFLKELEQEHIYIDRATMIRYFEEGSNGPKSSEEKCSLYEKIAKDFEDFEIHMFTDKDDEIFIEDREEKVPKFCQKKLEGAFENILRYLVDAYNGRYTLLFESDYSKLLFYFEIYKPCAPNYLCCEVQEFFKKKFHEIKENAVNSGMIIFEDIGFCYRTELSEGEDADVDDCELAEDYIKNNQEEHRERVINFMYDVVEFWEKNVERLYPSGEGQAKKFIFEKYCKKAIDESNTSNNSGESV